MKDEILINDYGLTGVRKTGFIRICLTSILQIFIDLKNSETTNQNLYKNRRLSLLSIEVSVPVVVYSSLLVTKLPIPQIK